jgi:hypothetical protein
LLSIRRLYIAVLLFLATCLLWVLFISTWSSCYGEVVKNVCFYLYCPFD